MSLRLRYALIRALRVPARKARSRLRQSLRAASRSSGRGCWLRRSCGVCALALAPSSFLRNGALGLRSPAIIPRTRSRGKAREALNPRTPPPARRAPCSALSPSRLLVTHSGSHKVTRSGCHNVTHSGSHKVTRSGCHNVTFVPLHGPAMVSRLRRSAVGTISRGGAAAPRRWRGGSPCVIEFLF